MFEGEPYDSDHLPGCSVAASGAACSASLAGFFAAAAAARRVCTVDNVRLCRHRAASGRRGRDRRKTMDGWGRPWYSGARPQFRSRRFSGEGHRAGWRSVQRSVNKACAGGRARAVIYIHDRRTYCLSHPNTLSCLVRCCRNGCNHHGAGKLYTVHPERLITDVSVV